MRWIVETSLKFRLLVVALAAVMIAVGVVQLRTMPVDVHPEFTPTRVEVQTEALGLSAKEVEQLITVPLEQDLLVGVPFLDQIESASLPGLSSVLMTFEPGTDLLDARQVVQERLTQAVGVAGLPNVAKLPQMIQPVSTNRRMSMVKISSDKLTPIEVSVLARWVISPRLMGVPGVANVAVWGFRDRQLQVLVDPQRLQRSGTTLGQVIKTAGNSLEVSSLSFLEASTPGTGGFIDTVNQRLNIFHEQAITTAKELAQVPLEGAGEGQALSARAGTEGSARTAAPRTLGDVAKVVESNQPLIGDAVCPGGERCLFLVVEKFPGANTLQVTQGVERALAAMRPGLGDMRIDSSLYRPASYIQSSFSHLGWALAVGGLLLLLLIGALFRSWRRLVVSVVAIAASLAAAVTVLSLRGDTINLMVVAGLALGLTAVIPDAVVDPHEIARGLRRGRQRGPASGTVASASVRARRGALYAFLITAAAIAPLLFLRGEGQAFLPPIVLSYLLAVATSMLVALTLTPVLALLLLANEPRPRSRASWGGSWRGRLRRRYDREAPRLVSRRAAGVGAAAALAALGLAVAPFLDTSLRPSLKERDVLVRVEAAPGTSLPQMTAITRRAVADLGSLPGIVNVGGQVGRAVMSDAIVNVNSGEVWLKIDPRANYERTLASVKDTLRRHRGVSAEVRTYSDDRVAEILGRSGDDVVVRIYGESPGVLNAKAEEIKGLVAGVDGVGRATVNRSLEESTVQVRVDLARAQAAGVKPGDVRRAAATLLGGMTVGNLFDQQKVFDVVVWGTPEIRRSVRDIEQLLIDAPNGGHVRVGQVADVRIVSSPTVIRHESVSPYLDVTADVAGRDVAAVGREVEQRVGKVVFPLEYHAELLGGYGEQQAARTRVVSVAVAAAVAILLLLQVALRSWRLAALAFGALPLALVGGLVAALLNGATGTLGSVAGLVAVLGIAARAVIPLLRHYQHLEHGEGMRFGPELVVRGTRESLAPMAASMIAVAVVLVPVVVLGSESGLEVVHPMAVTILGGLVSTALVSLFVVPVLYLIVGGSADRDTVTDDLLVPVPHQQQGEGSAREARTALMERFRSRRLIALPVAALATGLLSGCGGVVTDKYKVEHEPARIEPMGSGNGVRLAFASEAVQRLRISTAPVKKAAGGLAVPSSAVFIDTSGSWWVYTNPQPLVFVRAKVSVVREAGGIAYLSTGPAVGTPVVTVGVPELRGVEEKVGH